MPRPSVLGAIIFVLPFTAFTQQWVRQESGTTANLRGVWFVDSLSGWACGDSGMVLHTSDGGQHWISQNSGMNLRLEDVFFRDSQNGWIVGDSGTIIHTSNGGMQWTTQPTGIPTNLRQVDFLGLPGGIYDAFVVGNQGTVVTTTDLGLTWSGSQIFGVRDVSALIYAEVNRWLFFIDKQLDRRWSVQYRTSDQGMTWDTTLSLLPFVHDTWARVRAGSYFYWAACRGGYLLSSTNTGFAWRIGLIDIPDSTIDYYGITLDTLDWRLWAVGRNGKIVSSIDSGRTWQSQASPVQANLNEVSFPSRNVGWAVGDSGVILRYGTVVSAPEPNLPLLLQFTLSSVYPNPFNPKATIELFLPNRELLSVGVYDILGREVTRILEEVREAGWHKIRFDASNLPSGAYLIRTVAGPHLLTTKAVLMK